ncbi:Gfo/Idh/MocA family protein [Erysipelothrix tonsillarum]|uniref:Gfo/Idh/MocA family protein n=1 Tax=Erysipelothrix tonsillarum TaxID=38402 RepID=UPI000370E3C4|nr:Gfo/Idh/MocA family oxidoreductase [Erysipelothrix tonsillarum]
MNIGTIGTGVIVEQFIASTQDLSGVSFKAVYSRTQGRADALAKRFGIEKRYTKLDDLFSDSLVDTIYIASPNSLHYEQAFAALKAGKHVIVEKPFVETEERAQRLIRYAQEHDLFLFEAICNIHLPHYNFIKSNLEVIGDIKMVQCNFSQYSSRYDALLAGDTPNVFNPKYSGGALADINIYNIHFVVGIFGMPDEVMYYANKHSNGIDTSGVLVMNYPHMTVECVGAKDSFSQNFGQIQGEKGYIYIPESVSGIESVTIITKDSKEMINIQDQPRLSYQVEVFEKAIRTRDYSIRDRYLEHTLNVVRIAEKAQKTANN